MTLPPIHPNLQIGVIRPIKVLAMEILETPVGEGLIEEQAWGDAAPPKLEEQELDIVAFELWQRGSRQDAAGEEDCSNDEEVVGGHASCL